MAPLARPAGVDLTMLHSRARSRSLAVKSSVGPAGEEEVWQGEQVWEEDVVWQGEEVRDEYVWQGEEV